MVALFYVFFTHLFILGLQLETDSYSAAKDYKTIPGTQIYLFDRSNAFSYISIDSTSTSRMKATVYLYLTGQLTTISNGVYTSIGFGTSQMSGSDILLCAVTQSGNQWCKDFVGGRSDITETGGITTLISAEVNSLGAVWSPFITQVIWKIERAINPTTYINGLGNAIYAYGSLDSSGNPQRHPNGYYNSIRSGDGNTGNSPSQNTGGTASANNESTQTGTNFQNDSESESELEDESEYESEDKYNSEKELGNELETSEDRIDKSMGYSTNTSIQSTPEEQQVANGIAATDNQMATTESTSIKANSTSTTLTPTTANAALENSSTASLKAISIEYLYSLTTVFMLLL